MYQIATNCHLKQDKRKRIPQKTIENLKPNLSDSDDSNISFYGFSIDQTSLKLILVNM